MANQTVTFQEHNVMGNRREDRGRFTADGTTGEVVTRLHWIEYVEFQSTIGSTGASVDVYPNNTSTGAAATLAPGTFHYNSTGSDIDTKICQFIAVGW